MSTKIIAKSVLAGAVGVLAAGQEAEAGPTESGFYGGLSFNNTDGRAWQYDFYDISGSGVGGFVGYNHVMGTAILGFELSMPAGADASRTVVISRTTLTLRYSTSVGASVPWSEMSIYMVQLGGP